MLIALSIRDFVLIRSLDLEFGDGFSALTGETGAGKSILLSALGFALGHAFKAGAASAAIRAKAERASITASFEPAADSEIWRMLDQQGVDASSEDGLVLKRIVKRGGSARGFINDQPVSARLLAEIGARLVEIHGQHASHALLSPARHRDMLDAFADTPDAVDACSAAWTNWRSAIDTRDALAAKCARIDADRAYLAHALEEIDALDPQAGEADALAAERSSLQSAEQANEALAEAAESFGRNGAEERLAAAAKAINRALGAPALQHSAEDSALPARLTAAAEAVERALIETGEAAHAVRSAQSESLACPDTLENVETRLFALRALARKHDGDPDQLPRLRAKLALQLEEVEDADAAAEKAEKAQTRAKAVYESAALCLSDARKKAAAKLERAVGAELKPLKLGKARFRAAIALKPLEDAGPKGWDDVAFEIAPQADADFGPLNKIASGGELARFALALKVRLARAGGAQTLIFDEADVGVGGATAAAIGARLKTLSRDRQVLAITHSPQVAAAADAQWRIEKCERRGAQETTMIDLTTHDRQEEIARMLAGSEITREARAAADRLLAQT